MRKIIPYRSDLKEKAKLLRNNSTLPEVLLWNHLKQKQMYGYRFHRQKPILDYIVDFYAPDLMLVIEIDGFSHNDSAIQDHKRQNEIEQLGIHFLRFLDGDIKHRMDDVLVTIQEWIEEHGKS
ncbi:MAG: endonuclease domain-containing protein [Candidatus Marinimicrobia bacterium]|nr:endonuclease domain-containing protein [Candidatus Neomarinimicrobiota bacterium]MCF7839907.1 endonuclease domain-containing protein [Candidatus Neomarinimicrobiota bacterium]MCF7903187.1 endonuclease domain-containing protein [Candidatus Neomarinimicrobiota bacterium]